MSNIFKSDLIKVFGENRDFYFVVAFVSLSFHFHTFFVFNFHFSVFFADRKKDNVLKKCRNFSCHEVDSYAKSDFFFRN